MMLPVFSIIMPTYNAEKTIRMALESLRSQTIPAEKIELLVIDGGSTDNTLSIAQEFDAIILENPDRLPEKAKYIGLQHAQGTYIVKMDSDEIFTHTQQLENRLSLMESVPNLACVVPNRLTTPPFDMANFSRSYINNFGDPFTFFVYQLKGSVLNTFQRANHTTFSNGIVLGFGPTDILPIADAGTTTFSNQFTKTHFLNERQDLRFMTNASQLIIRKTGLCGCIPGDDILHFSNASFGGYLKKLRFRVINNIYGTKDSGYANRATNSKKLSRRKSLFILYVLSVIFPLVDSIRISIAHRDASLMAHFLYVYYVFALIVYYFILKLSGKVVTNQQY